MGRVIAVANQKGGVGKTTTTVNLAASLAQLDKKVLLIDMDPQGNATSGLGIDKDGVELSVYNVLLEELTDNFIVKELYPSLDVVPASVHLAAAEIELIHTKDKEYLLKNRLAKYVGEYDYILIDCPPSLNILTLNAMTFADSVLVPIQCEYYALEGLSQLMYTTSLVRERMNENLEIEGIVFTMYDGRNNLSKEVIENVQENLKEYIFKTYIPRNIRLAEAPSYGMPITVYDPSCAGGKAYEELAHELVNK